MQFYSKSTQFTESNVQEISEQFCKLFPKSRLEEAYETFSWGKAKTSENAMTIRQAIYKEFSSWANSKNLKPNASEQIQKVHKWGFGRNLDKREANLLKDPHLTYFLDMIQTWQISQDPKKMLDTLEKSLLTPHVKIARFSKWICFIDQSKYAIYDSRVSLALRTISLKHKRVFPTLGAKSEGRPNGDYISRNPQIAAEKIAGCYMLYLDILHTTLGEYDLSSVAQIEMALFMLGPRKEYW